MRIDPLYRRARRIAPVGSAHPCWPCPPLAKFGAGQIKGSPALPRGVALALLSGVLLSGAVAAKAESLPPPTVNGDPAEVAPPAAGTAPAAAQPAVQMGRAGSDQGRERDLGRVGGPVGGPAGGGASQNPPAGGDEPAKPGSNGGAVNSMQIPADFANWPREKQLRFLQEQLDVVELLEALTTKQHTIMTNLGQVPAARAPAGEGGAQVQPNKGIEAGLGRALGGPAPPKATIKRIHVVDGQRVAEVEFEGQGQRRMKPHDAFPDGSVIKEITPDEILFVDPSTAPKGR